MAESHSETFSRYLGRAILWLLPYYQQFVPVAFRTLVSTRWPAWLRRPLALVRAAGVTSYDDWILQNEKLGEEDCNLIHAHIASFAAKPTFSILMPVYNPPLPHLREAIDSVLGQLYGEWELCIADDASTSPQVRIALHRYSLKDPRIKVRFRDTNGGISACTNTALDMATGEWIALMDHDDVLAAHALYLVADAVNRHSELAIIYSDEDHIDAEGRRSNPYFKPDWDYDLFLSQNLISHLGIYRADLAHRVGGFREGFEGSQDWDFALRVLEASADRRVHHIPFVLYHWRQTPRTFSNASLGHAVNSARRAVSEHLMRTRQPAEVAPLGASSYLRIRRNLPTPRPLVSIIIPTRDKRELLHTCVDGLVNRTSYRPFEVVIVDNGSTEREARDFLAQLRSRPGFTILEDERSFNFSRLVNQGVAASSGEICVLLNNDIDVINADWLDEMVSQAIRPDIGVVGAKLYYDDDTLQHGGVILGISGIGAHQHRRATRKAYGYFGRLQMTHSLSCVTAACLAVRRAVYDEVGGFDENHLPVAFNDVDFCIRVRKAGYRIIWTPHAELYHYESCSRGDDTTPENAARFAREIRYMRSTWGDLLDNDPFYNPNLSLSSDFFAIAATSRARKPWLKHGRSAGYRTSLTVIANSARR